MQTSRPQPNLRALRFAALAAALATALVTRPAQAADHHAYLVLPGAASQPACAAAGAVWDGTLCLTPTPVSSVSPGDRVRWVLGLGSGGGSLGTGSALSDLLSGGTLIGGTLLIPSAQNSGWVGGSLPALATWSPPASPVVEGAMAFAAGADELYAAPSTQNAGGLLDRVLVVQDPALQTCAPLAGGDGLAWGTLTLTLDSTATGTITFLTNAHGGTSWLDETELAPPVTLPGGTASFQTGLPADRTFKIHLLLDGVGTAAGSAVPAQVTFTRTPGAPQVCFDSVIPASCPPAPLASFTLTGVAGPVDVTDGAGSPVTCLAALAISPGTASLPPRGSRAFTASGGTGSYAWSLSASPSGGSISAAGSYTAGATGGVTDVVLVTDSLGGTATRNVSVTAGVVIAPASASVVPRGSLTFTASGGSGTGFVWSLAPNNSGGSISAAGAYTAGATGNVTDTVQVTDSLGNTDTSTVTVGAGVTISPATASVAPRGAQAFTASGGSGSGFVWSLGPNNSGGSISAAGAYTAGATGNVTDTVRVTDSLGNTDTSTVTVGAGVVIAPASASVAPRGSLTFTASGGSGAGFTWSLSANASGGAIDPSTGGYTAGATGGVSDTVRVTDSLGNAATRSVTVGAAVTISPATASLPPRGTQTFTATGGSGPYAWSLTSAPSGGSINATTGAYTAGATGGVTDVVLVTDALGGTATRNASVTAGVVIAPATASVAPHGSLTFTASGGSGTGFTWSLSANASGGAIDPTTGGYTAGATGGVTDTVRVTDSLGNAATRSVTVGAAVAISPGATGVPPRGTQSFTASGGSGAGFVWSLSPNNSGGSISAAGAYTAGATGNVTDTVRVTDSLGNAATSVVTVGAGVTISPASASVAPHGPQTFTASGGSGSGFVWSLSPNNSGGSISAAGAYTAGATGGVTDTVRVTDSLGNAATRSVTVGAAVTISPATASVAPHGPQAFTASGGSGAGFVWSLSPNNSGGSISAAGAYTAGATGNVIDTVRVTDSLGNTDTSIVTVTAGVVIAPASASVAPHGSLTFTASGGSGAGFTWSLSANSSGGTIDPSTGGYTAGATGGVTDTVRVTDSLGNAATRSVTVTAGVAISPATASLPPRGTQTFTATGGSGPYAWSLGTNNSGGSIGASGAYTAGTTGGVTDVVLVTDALGGTATRNVSVTAGVGIAPATANVVPRGSLTFTASGGSGSGFVWSLSPNNSGGSISAAGAYIAGATGGVTDTVRVTDSLGNTATRSVTVGAAVAISPGATGVPPRGGLTFTASGGSGTGYAWSLTSAPSGGSINATTGAYTAGPTGNTIDVVRLVDSLGSSATANVSVSSALSITASSTTTPPRGHLTFSGAGGSGAGYAWVIATNLSGGAIGVSTGAYAAGVTGSVTDVVQLSDSLGNTVNQAITVTAGVAIAPATASLAPRGSQAFTASGGSGTGFAWSLATNASGGSVSAAGLYTAGATGGVSDVVQVTDSLGNTDTSAVTVGAAVSIAPATASVAPRGSQAFTASGGSGAGFTWSLATNASGGSVSAAGLYTAGPAGGVTDVVRVADPLGNVATRSVTVTAAVTVAPASVTVPPRGTQSFTASGGSGAGFTWSLATNGSAGTINPTTGAYAAGPTGGVTDVVQATDSLGNVATRSVTVTAGLAIAPASATVAPRGTQAFTASGGSGAGFAWSLSTGASGGSISAAGLYTAGAAGGVTDVVQVADSLGNVATRSVTVTAGLVIAPATATAAPRGPLAFSASGGSGAGFAWSLLSRPSGGTIDPATGAYLAGPTGGVIDVVRVTDSLGNVASRNVTVGPTVSITPGSLGIVPRGSQAFAASGGSGTGYAWSLLSRPSGGTITAGGLYTAGTTGGVTDVVQLADSLGNTATASVSVSSALSITASSTSVPPRGHLTFGGSGGSGTGYLWSLATNASGGTIDPTSGAYTAGPAPNVSDLVQLSDSLGNIATQVITVTSGVSISPGSATLAPRGVLVFAATGGSGTGFAWSLSANASGGTIDPASGAYQAGPAGGVTDVVRVVDSLGNAATRSVTVGPGVSISPAAATVAPRGVQAFAAAGGSGSYTWSLSAAPSGGAINATTGAYTAGPAGGVTDVVLVTDSLGNTASRNVSVTAGVTIAPAAVTLAPRATQTFTAAGGSGTGYLWSLSTNASGGTINPATGAYAAGPTGGVTDVVRVADSLGNTATRSVTVTAGLAITPATATAAPRGTLTFSASGGSGAGYAWSLATDASGGSVSAAGVYTAGATGGVTDVVRLTDSLGNVATRSVTVTAGLVIAPATATAAPRGPLAFTASGGSGTGFAWSLATNASGGAIGATTGAYTAGTTGNVTDVVQVVDSLGNTATRNVAVGAPLAITPGQLGIVPRGSQAFAASGGSGAGYLWSFLSRPSGGAITAGGVYTAGATGGVTDVIQVADSLGNTATANASVSSGLSITSSATSVPPLGHLTFSGAGGSLGGYVWSLAGNASGGRIDATTGAYQAGAIPGVTDLVQLTDSVGNTASQPVTVTAGVTIAPPAANPLAGATVNFTASGGSGTGFTWSLATNASGGTIDAATGLYTAGPTGGVADLVQVADQLGNVATRTVTVVALPRLSLSATGPASLAAGGSATFTVTVTNQGGSRTTNTVAFQDTLPAGVTFRSQLGGAPLACTLAAQVITCAGRPGLAPGSSLAVTFDAGVSLGATGTLTSAALISAGGGDPRPLPTTCTAPVPAAGAGSQSADGLCARWSSGVVRGTLQASLALRSVNGGEVPTGYRVAPGDLLELAVSVVETSGRAGGTLQVLQTVPAATQYAGTGQGWAPGCAHAGSTCTQDFAVGAGQGASAAFTLRVDAVLPDDLLAVADVLSAEAGACPGCTVSYPTVPKLSVSLVSPALLPLGGSASLAATVQNRGGSATSGLVAITTTLAEGLSFLRQDAGAPEVTCTASGQAVTCAGNPTLQPAGTLEVAFTISVAPHASGDLTSTATLTGLGGDPRAATCDAAVPGTGSSSQAADGTCSRSTGTAGSGQAVEFSGGATGCGCTQGARGPGGPGLEGLAVSLAVLLGPALRRRRRR